MLGVAVPGAVVVDVVDPRPRVGAAVDVVPGAVVDAALPKRLDVGLGCSVAVAAGGFPRLNIEV